MVEKRRTESALTGRPLRERVLGQTRQLAGIVESLAPSRDEPGRQDLGRQDLGRQDLGRHWAAKIPPRSGPRQRGP